MELPFFTTTASSSSTTTKAEALRWLAIAEKLLAGRDLVGSKSFASRARESDPTLVYADQIIAVADTLLAGDKRINNNQPDWYSILQLPGHRTHDPELIAGQYRKLVLLLNPQKNKLPYADQAFNLVMSSWSVLSNPSRKAMYDNEFMSHLTVNSPSGGFNPMFSSASREQVQVNYHQPFELNFQVMPQPQPQPQPQQPQAQQGMVTGQVNEMQQLHGMGREQVNLQLPSHHVGREQVSHSMPQLNLSREHFWQSQPPQPPQPQLPPQLQPQPQLQSQTQQPLQQPHAQVQHQNLNQTQPMQHQNLNQPQPTQYQNLNQPQPTQHQNLNQPQPTQHQNLNQPLHQHQPQPMQQRKEHWMDNTAREIFSGGVGGTNAQIGNTRAGAQNEYNLNRNFVGGEDKEEIRVNQSPPVDDKSSFWTACPYCYYMYQYPDDYVECVFKCQNSKCRKAFHGEAIPSPPPIVEGQESYFCCWGTIPLGVSMNVLDRNAGVNGKWTPFSPVFNGPIGAGNNVSSGNVSFFGGWNANNNVQRASGGGYVGGRMTTGQRAYVEDDVLEFSEPDDESDDDWRTFGKKKTKVKKKDKRLKRKGSVISNRQVRKTQMDSKKDGVDSDTVPGGVVTESIKEGAFDSSKKSEDAELIKTVVAAESDKKGGANTVVRRQSTRKANEFGRLDLNVEFSNEVEESVGGRANRGGNAFGRRVEDIIEGAGFFEGLDEFLSSLPILNVVGDNKVKAA